MISNVAKSSAGAHCRKGIHHSIKTSKLYNTSISKHQRISPICHNMRKPRGDEERNLEKIEEKNKTTVNAIKTATGDMIKELFNIATEPVSSTKYGPTNSDAPVTRLPIPGVGEISASTTETTDLNGNKERRRAVSAKATTVQHMPTGPTLVSPELSATVVTDEYNQVISIDLSAGTELAPLSDNPIGSPSVKGFMAAGVSNKKISVGAGVTVSHGKEQISATAVRVTPKDTTTKDTTTKDSTTKDTTKGSAQGSDEFADGCENSKDSAATQQDKQKKLEVTVRIESASAEAAAETVVQWSLNDDDADDTDC